MSNEIDETKSKPPPPKRVAIIGAGVVGIAAAKCCLEQNLDVVIFERSEQTGGLWRFRDNSSKESEESETDGTATVMHSTVINSNKEVSAFSDFPPPDWYPNFMPQYRMMEYIENYGNRFNFNRYVRLRHEVISAEPALDYSETGKWVLTIRKLTSQKHPTTSYRNEMLDFMEELEVCLFDAVYVCTGHHGHVSMAQFEDQHRFRGKIVHSHDVKRPGTEFNNKTAVVVGLGNSGADLAAELANISKQVYVSIRHGTWVAHRVGPFGLPLDHFFLRRIVAQCLRWFPYSLFCWIFEAFLNFRFDHSRYKLEPNTRILSQHITVNDALPNLIISGKVLIRPEIKRFTEEGVIFEGKDNEEYEVKCDTVILATGYRIKFPFLSSDLVPVHQNELHLYKYMFPAHHQHPETLAFLGLIQPLGPIMPAAELQARWATALLSGRCKPLPSEVVMNRDIERQKVIRNKRFYASERHTISFDWFPYMDDIGEQLGVKPPMWRYLLLDPILWFKLLFGCAAAYQWRLVGPHAWPKARETILNLNHRIEQGFGTRVNDQTLEKKKKKQKKKEKQNKTLPRKRICTIAILLMLFAIVVSIVSGWIFFSKLLNIDQIVRS